MFPLDRSGAPCSASPRLTLGALLFATGFDLSCTPAVSAVPATTSVEGAEREQPSEPEGAAPIPRLVLWLTVDQMRPEVLDRFSDHFGDGGFRRLESRGVVFEQAHHAHAITETAPGHATLFTGVAPEVHGIIGNSWWDDAGNDVPSVADDAEWLVGPDIQARTQPGRSPRRLLVPTVGDALLRASGGKGHSIALSLKDRGAVLPAGHGGLAFWWGGDGFVTSTYYLEKSPPWLEAHQRSFPLAGYLDEPWHLALPAARYLSPPSLREDGHEKLWGPAFPHQPGAAANPTSLLKTSPFGDEALLDFARTVLQEYELGQDAVPDLLAVSLSSTDYIGHFYGAESREMEDQMVRLDRQLASFLQFVDEQVGDGVLVVLSADHGVEDSPEFLRQAGVPGGRLTEEDVAEAARRALQAEYGSPDFLRGVGSPYVYLDRRAIEQASASLSDVRRTVATALTALPEVHSALDVDRVGTQSWEGPISLSLRPGRSGDVYVVPRPGVHFVQEASLFATHGTPWRRDQHVPLIFSSPHLEPARVARRVDVRSVAPTVSALLHQPPPNASRHEALVEILGRSETP